ncbi:unnamed protein product, partial [Effrenium voratum]
MSVSGPGPSSAADLRRWPLTVLDRLTQRNDGSDGERLHRLESHFRRGLCVYSDYSGISGEHEIFWQMTHALQQRSMYASMDSVQLTRVCDFGSVQQNVLMQLSALEPEGFCVMQDINDRLPPVARQVLDAAMPPRDADVVTAAAAYKDMASYLMDNRQWVYTDAFSQCLAHSRRCRLFRRIDDSPAQELDADSQPSPSKRPRVEGPRKLRINFAGTTCKGWSMAGKQLQFSDVSERPHAVWITERFRRAEVAEEDLFFSECTPKYPVQVKISEPLQPTHTVISVVVGPDSLGWPVRRKRVFCCGLSNATVAWLGPPEDQVQADFYKFFQATLQLTGDVFLLASPEEVYAEQTRLAKLRGHFLPETPAAVQKHQVYSPGQLVRLQAYDKMRLCKFGRDHPFFADLEQNAGYGSSTAGSILPSCLTHGTLHSWTADRLVTAKELFFAHGFNVFPDEAAWPVQCKVAEILEGLPSGHQKMLLGNGWHIPTLSSWVFYVLCHTVRINRHCSVRPERTLLRSGGSQLLEDSSQG